MEVEETRNNDETQHNNDETQHNNDAQFTNRLKEHKEDILSTFKAVIQETISKVLEDFAALIFATVYIHGVSVDGKKKLVREGLDAIWKEVQDDTNAEGWTQVTRRKSGTISNNAPDENTQPEAEHDKPSTSNTRTTPNQEAAKWNPHKGRQGWKKK